MLRLPFSISHMPVSREFTPAGISAHSRQHVQVTSPNQTSGPRRQGDKAEAQKAYSTTVSVVDKGVQKGVLHTNTASRYKARLNKRVKAVGAAK